MLQGVVKLLKQGAYHGDALNARIDPSFLFV